MSPIKPDAGSGNNAGGAQSETLDAIRDEVASLRAQLQAVQDRRGAMAPGDAWQRSLLESAFASVGLRLAVLQGPDLRHVMANPAYVAATGCGEVVGRQYRDLFPGAADCTSEAQLLKVLETGQPCRLDGSAPNADHKAGWRGHAVRLATRPGEAASLLVMAWEDPEDRQADLALQESEDRLRFALETSHTGAWEVDLETDVAQRSLEHDRIFGYAEVQPEWTYATFLRHVHPEDRPTVDGTFQQAIRHRNGWSLEFRIQRADGQRRWIWAAGRYREDANGRRMAGIVQDVTERKGSEETLRQTQASLENFLNTAATGLVRISADFRYLSVNQAFARLVGLPPSQIVGRPLVEVLGQPIFDRICPHLDRVRGGERVEQEAELAFPLTGPKWVHVIYNPEWEDGKVVGWVASITDISARKQAEEASRKSAALARQRLAELEDIYRTAPVGLCVLDRDLRFVRINERLAAIHGIPAAAHLGKSVRELMPELADVAESDLRQILATGEPRRDVEILGTTPAQPGVPRSWNVQWLPIKDGDGGVGGVSIVVEETTERRKAEETLRRSERRHRSFVELTNQWEWITDPAGRVVEDVPQLRAFTGQSFEQAKGTGWADALHPEDRERTFEIWREAVAAKTPYETEYRMKRHDGAYRVLLARAVPILDDRGEVTEWVGRCIDVTERRMAEDALRQALANAEAGQRTLEALMANVPEGITLCDADGKLLLVSEHGQRLLGGPHGGKTVAEVVADWVVLCPDGKTPLPIDELPAVRALRGETVQDVEVIQVNAEGRQLPLLCNAAPICDAAGRIVAAVVVWRDISDRKQVEKALRESEERLRLLGDNLPDSAVYQYVLDADGRGRFGYMSAGIQRLTGVSRGDVLRDPDLFHGQIPPEYLATLADAQARSQRELSDFDIEVPMRRPDGETRWIRLHSRPRRLPDGGTIWDGVQIDVTERRAAEAALLDSEERFRLFMDNSPTIAWVKDEDGRHVYLSRAYEQRFGVRLDDWRGKTDAELWPPETAAEFRKNDLAVLSSSQPLQVTEETCNPDGSRCYWLNSKFPFCDAAGRRYVGGIGLDITSQKQAEAALRESEARYRAIGESLPYGVWACDAQGRNTYASDSFLQLVGLTQAQCAEFGWGDVLHPDDADRTIAAWKECSRTGGKWDIQHRFRGVDGQYHDILARGVPIRNEHGEITSWAGINLDISRLKETERALEDARAQLQAYAQELEDRVAQRTARLEETVTDLEHFSYAITHDMRAPLRAMQGFSHLLAEECGEAISVEGHDYLRRIRSAADRLDRLITDALNYGRAARDEPRLETVDLDALVPDLIETYPNLQSVMAGIHISGPLPAVRGNTAALTQCFANLLGNAVKFAKPACLPEIRIRSERSPLGPDWARIWVEDDGIGIPAESLPRIFGLFQRATASAEGTGIGLAIVRKVVERMGGQVGVESTDGQGSRFWVDLPLPGPGPDAVNEPATGAEP